MKYPIRLIAACAAAFIFTGALPLQSADRQYVHRRMIAAGFIPLDEMTFGGRDVRRILAVDPYSIIPIPGIELERHKDGRRTIRAQYRGWTGPAYALSNEDWQRLSRLELKAFAPPEGNTTPLKADVVVHCWSGILEASPDRVATWSKCNTGTRRAQAYSEAILALATRKMDCPPSTKETLWHFAECFVRMNKLDDPVLGAMFTDLQARWQKEREPVPTMLAKARRSLNAARANRTDDLINLARDAVFAYGRQQKKLDDILQSGFVQFQETESRGGAAAVILKATQNAWRDDIAGSNRHYTDLLEDLVGIQSIGSK